MMSEPDAEEFVFENSKVRRQPIRRRPTGKHVFWKPFISTAIWFMIIMVPILRICLSYATSSFTGKLHLSKAVRPDRPLTLCRFQIMMNLRFFLHGRWYYCHEYGCFVHAQLRSCQIKLRKKEELKKKTKN